MNITDTHTYAKWLLETRKDQAELYAADEQQKYEAAGKTDEAESWRKIRSAIREMRGAHES
jgi:hypothetical protein